MRVLLATLAMLTVSLCASAAERPNGKIVGKESAPIRLEVFSDFSCPGCKMFHEQVLPVLMRDFVSQGKAYIVFRDYVLPPSPGHEHSDEAARLAVAANRVGKYREVADVLFLNQASWAKSGKVWETVAAALTPDEQKRVQVLIKDASVADEVQRDTTAGNRAGLVRTPTVGVNFRTEHQLWNQWGGDNSLFFGYLRELLKK